MSEAPRTCGDCETTTPNRREFLASAAATSVALPLLWATPKPAVAAPTMRSPAETAVSALYQSLTEEQKRVICFAWDYRSPNRGLLRTHVSNNWQITQPHIRSNFFTREQQTIIHDIFRGIINPEWYNRFVQQLRDDTGGQPWGAEQSIAIFGTPGEGNFEFVMTGRHMTLRADGNSTEHVGFGGPIFYGHAAEGFNEKADHPNNVFWPQALLANGVFAILDEAQQRRALLPRSPAEAAVGFRGPNGQIPGLPVSEMTHDQKAEMQRVLAGLLEPFRVEDQAEALECLRQQGGLDACYLSFYADSDIGNDGVWDNWRLEGPSFVWYFRGRPHVHVWVNVASNPNVPLNARG
jgi:hypothetical protein